MPAFMAATHLAAGMREAVLYLRDPQVPARDLEDMGTHRRIRVRDSPSPAGQWLCCYAALADKLRVGGHAP
eukprot:3280437-Rhodomonas_salina.3